MTGIMVAAAGGTANAIYVNGLYNTTYGAELSPIDIGTQSSQSGFYSVTYEWVGYYRPANSGPIALGAISPYTEYINYSNSGTFQQSWGGGGNSTCYIWTGNTAKSGYNASNYTAFIQNGTGSQNFTALANTYVPMRVQWSTSLPYNQQYSIFQVITYFAQSSFTLTIGGTSSISGRIFYNSLTNGF